MVTPALEAGKQLGATVVNMRFVKPIDTELVLELAKSHDVLITVEENVLAGGAGSAVNDFLQAQQILMPVSEHRPAGQLCRTRHPRGTAGAVRFGCTGNCCSG